MVVIEIDKVAEDWSDHADERGITPTRQQSFNEGHTKAVQLDTIDRICKRYKCLPGDFIKYVED